MTITYRHRWQPSLIYFGPKIPLFGYEVEHHIPAHVEEKLQANPGSTVVCVDDERLTILMIQDEEKT